VLAKTPVVWIVPADNLKQAEALVREMKGIHPLEDAKLKDPKSVIEYVQKNVKAPRARPVGTDADTYAVNAIDLLRKLAEARNRVFNYLQAEAALIRALDDEREPVARAAAGALAFYPTAQAQRALATAGVKKGREPVQLSALAALAESGRKHAALINLKSDAPLIEKLANQSQEQAASQDIRTASVASLGALNLPPKKVFEILSTTVKTE
jgi:hypothetical protein